MHKLLATFLICGLVSFSIALAEDGDSDRVVREEHVARAAQTATNSQPASHDNASVRRQDDANLPEAEHGQDLLDERAQMADRSHPDTLELDSLGLYFGLGEHFVDAANALIDERQAGYNERGSYPVFSRLSDGPLGDLSVSNEPANTHGHQHEQDSASDDGNGGVADHNINRRGSDHDYFYD
jgi:hypothetical protein